MSLKTRLDKNLKNFRGLLSTEGELYGAFPTAVRSIPDSQGKPPSLGVDVP